MFTSRKISTGESFNNPESFIGLNNNNYTEPKEHSYPRNQNTYSMKVEQVKNGLSDAATLTFDHNHNACLSGEDKQPQLRAFDQMLGEGESQSLSEKLYQCNYVNGRDIDNMFALYRKIQLSVAGKDERNLNLVSVGGAGGEQICIDSSSLPQADRLGEIQPAGLEPSTPTLKRFSRLNNSGRFPPVQQDLPSPPPQNNLDLEHHQKISPPIAVRPAAAAKQAEAESALVHGNGFTINHHAPAYYNNHDLLDNEDDDTELPPPPPPSIPPDRDKPASYRRLRQFEPCGSPIDEMSGEETAGGQPLHCVTSAIIHAEDFPALLKKTASEKERRKNAYAAGDRVASEPPGEARSKTLERPTSLSPPRKDATNVFHAGRYCSDMNIDSNSLPWNAKYGADTNSLRKYQVTQDGNWVLRERTPALEASGINRSMIAITSPTKNFRAGSMRHAFSELHKGQHIFASAEGGLNRDRYLTHGRLKLYKSNSIGRHSSGGSDSGSDYSSWGRNSTMRLSQHGGSLSSRSSNGSFINGMIPEDSPPRESLPWPKPNPGRIHVSEVFSQHPPQPLPTMTAGNNSKPPEITIPQPGEAMLTTPPNVYAQQIYDSPLTPTSMTTNATTTTESWPPPPDEVLKLPVPELPLAGLTVPANEKTAGSGDFTTGPPSPTPNIFISRADTVSLSTNSSSGIVEDTTRTTAGRTFGKLWPDAKPDSHHHHHRQSAHNDANFDKCSSGGGTSTYDDAVSISSMSSSGRSTVASSMRFRSSCPDLIQPCLQQQHSQQSRHRHQDPNAKRPSVDEGQVKGHQDGGGQLLSRSRKNSRQLSNCQVRNKRPPSKDRQSSTAPWDTKPLKKWDLTDIILWLQHLDLGNVASLVVGYDLTGDELRTWDKETMTNLGIEESAQRTLLNELRALKKIQAKQPSRRSSPIRSLFPLIQQCTSSLSQDMTTNPGGGTEETDGAPRVARQIIALTLDRMPSLNTGFSIAEGTTGGLVVTRAKHTSGKGQPLLKGDCIIEINGQSTLNMAAVDFNCLLSGTAQNRLVVLRDVPLPPATNTAAADHQNNQNRKNPNRDSTGTTVLPPSPTSMSPSNTTGSSSQVSPSSMTSSYINDDVIGRGGEHQRMSSSITDDNCSINTDNFDVMHF